MVIGVRTDILFPLHQQRELAAGLADVSPNSNSSYSTASVGTIPSSWRWTRSGP